MKASTEAAVRVRAGDLCEYCRLPQSIVRFRFHIERIIARQHRGRDELDNLALACPRCNRRKGPNLSGIDPLDESVVRLFDPRGQRWTDHFAIDGSLIVGITPTGRASVDTLRVNDAEDLANRLKMRRADLWPPETPR